MLTLSDTLPLVTATRLARQRRGDTKQSMVGTSIRNGLFQVNVVTYAKDGTSTVAPLSDWLSLADAVAFLNRL
jgi:hypothetical protein